MRDRAPQIRPALAKAVRQQPTGASLPTVIMVVALMMTLAFTVVAIGFNHLNLSFRSNNNTKAEHLAEAVLSLAIEKARLNVDEFGLTGSTADRTIILTLDSLPEGSRGVLSFDPSTAAELGVPFSTNNRSESSVEGSNPMQPVPGQSLHLVARAEVKGAFSTMEAVISVPKFPYSIASGGAIRSNGGLLVAAVRPDTAYDLSSPIHREDLRPGHLVTNSTQGDGALVLTGNNTIMGDIQSASGATIDSDTEVLGETRLGANQVNLPKLDARDYDPYRSSPAGPAPGTQPGEDEVQEVNSGAGVLNVKGYNVFGQKRADDTYNPDAHLVVDNGITLQGGVLYVNGNLTVSAGGVKGKGAIVATGNIIINGGGEATTDNQAALVANGDITLRGTSSEKAKFAGLIYTKGDLQAENMRLAGVFVAAGQDTDDNGLPRTPSEVTLQNTELYQVEEHSRFEIKSEFVIPNVIPGANTIDGMTIEASYDLSSLRAKLQNYKNPNSEPGEPEYLFKYKQGKSYYRHKIVNGNTEVVDASDVSARFLIDGGVLGLRIFDQPISSVENAKAVIIAELESRHGVTLSTDQRDTAKSHAESLWTAMQAGYQFSFESATQALEDGGSEDGLTPGRVHWSLDLSEFLGSSKPMRIMSWRRYSDSF